MQLERILHSQGFGTRRQCRALIHAGEVAVDGVVRTDPAAELATDGLVLQVRGEAWPFHDRLYLALHKPAGYECSRSTQHHASVFELLPRPFVERGVQCVGRLDEDTTGLLLLSDDGQFVHACTSPRRKLAKVYRARTRHPVDEALLLALRAGVLLHGEREPAVAVAAERAGERELVLTIAEGKYHQVKRMVAAAGNRVETLHREAIGGYALPASLAPGQWTVLDEDARRALATARDTHA
jgi:16S rRNA pseudouridine516 synthase